MREWQNTLWYILLVAIIQTGFTSNVKQMRFAKPINKKHELEQKYFELGKNSKTVQIQDLRAPCLRIVTTNKTTTTTQSTNDQEDFCDVMTENPKECLPQTTCQKKTEEPEKNPSKCEGHTEKLKQNNNQTVTPHAYIRKLPTPNRNVTPHAYIRKLLTPNRNNHDNQENEEEEEDDEEGITEELAKEITIRSLFSPRNSTVETTEETLEANTISKKESSNKASLKISATNTETMCETSTINAPTSTSCDIENLTTTNTAEQCNNNNNTTSSTTCKQVDSDTTTDNCKNTTLQNVTKTVECKPTLPTFLKHYQTYGKFKQIIIPIINETIRRKFNNTHNLKISHRVKKENNTKFIHLTNKLSFSDVDAIKDGDLSNSSSQNKSDWMHLLKARLQEGNSEYDDKPIKSNSVNEKYSFKESTKNNIFRNTKLSTNYDQDFMNYFLSNKLHHSKGISSNIQNDDKFNLNEFSHLINRKKLKDGKRNIYKKINYDLSMPSIDEDRYKYVQDYDSDINPNKINKFGYLFANFIKNLASNDEFSKSNDTYFDMLKNNDCANISLDKNKNEATNITATKIMKPSVDQTTKYYKEPNIQILNITQVFNLYSKLIPIKKYLEAVQASTLFSPLGRNINHYVISNAKLPHNNFPTNLNEYKVLKDLLQNYIKNLTELNLFNDSSLNNNENEPETGTFTELSNNPLYNNQYAITSRVSKTPLNEEHNKEKTAKMKSLKIVNDQIINLLKEMIDKTINNEVTESNNVQDDIRTMKQLSPSWDDSHKVDYY